MSCWASINPLCTLCTFLLNFYTATCCYLIKHELIQKYAPYVSLNNKPEDQVIEQDLSLIMSEDIVI